MQAGGRARIMAGGSIAFVHVSRIKGAWTSGGGEEWGVFEAGC